MRLNRTLAVSLVLASVLAVAPTDMLAQRSVAIGVSAGLSLPTGDMADFQASGYHVGGHLNLAPASLPFEVLLDATWHSFDQNTDNIFAEKFSYLNVGANAAYVFQGVSMRPYIMGGVGLYMGKADFEGAETSSDVGFNVGAGTRFMLSGLTSFLQVRANFVDDHTFVPISFGILF